MMKFRMVSAQPLLRKRFYSLKSSIDTAKKANGFQHTVFLPKTSFPKYLTGEKLVERDKRINEDAGFLDFYSWQRENLKGEEFVLHDGPPYANGKPHIGHAINKILKDIILRSQIVQGNRVHYIPGWDCHGLPIELTALKNIKNPLSPKEIREKAREVACLMSKTQKEMFKQWGIIGDWENQCYFTFDPGYVVNELQIFWKLFIKGIIYYDLKPVYWSLSSQTALAEAELLYKEDHESCALTVKFEVIQDAPSQPLYLLIWTTTPWTLPLNKAVYFSPELRYSIVKISSFPGLYILATDVIEIYKEKLNAEITEVSAISSEDLKKLNYKHPWNKDTMSVFMAPSVKLSGTGFLHSVPGHGHEDYVLGLQNNLKVECSVDEKGHYTADAGDGLSGLNIFNDGFTFVMERLSPEIILKEKYKHKYPYDWRTNKPIIIRASKQWFIDCQQLKERATKSLADVNVPLESFLSKLNSRPYWCLSRQRKWGVPIPAFFHKSSGRPLLSRDLINHLSNLFLSKGPDAWWTEPIETLLPKKFCSDHFVKIEDVVKGEDIMDIWFDSGVSWSHVLKGKKSELYLEGVDQYDGWFQTSLLTSVAVQNEAPYKRILTHGFAVDKNGRKMSKSLGNVVDPETILQGKHPFGVDVLRWWVASHAHHNLVPISDALLKAGSDSLIKIRSTLRFLLGALDDVSPEDLTNNNGLTCLDRYLLNSCYQFYHSVMDSYNSYNIHRVCANILYFVSNDISSRYVTVIKDRLYCDQLNSPRRKACQYTLNGILDTLCHAMAPVVPHLAEEVYSNHPVHRGKQRFFYKEKWAPCESWNDDSSSSVLQLVDEIKKEVTSQNSIGMVCEIQLEEKDLNVLTNLQGADQGTDSELTELLQVAEVRLKAGERRIHTFPTTSSFCKRCRRYTAPDEDKLCNRCELVVSQLVQSGN